MRYGYEEGDVCRRDGCEGVIEIHPSENCSCHIAPPCSACTEHREHCPKCGYERKHDVVINDYVTSIEPSTSKYRSWELRPLDPSKIDWHTKPHSSSSMLREGVYPEGATRAEVESRVRGTFGGRFEFFLGGKFRYVAYTD